METDAAWEGGVGWGEAGTFAPGEIGQPGQRLSSWK